MAAHWLEIGKVRTLNPARREVRVKPIPALAHQFAGRDWLMLRLVDQTDLRCRIRDLREAKGEYLIAFVPGVPMDNVRRMKNARVAIPEEEAVDRTDGGYHVDELPSIRVVTSEGEPLGTIVEALATGANDVIEVEKPSGGTMLLPVIPQLVLEIDLEAGIMTVGDITPYVVDNDED